MEDFFKQQRIDATKEERKFNQFYTEFFDIKLSPYIKNVKKDNFNCSIDCVNENHLDQKCLANCGKNEESFFKHIENTLESKVNVYFKCIEDCKKVDDNTRCTHKCIDETLLVLRGIDLNKEFKRFLN